MRIKRHDNERLVITHFPIFLAGLGLAPAVVALYVAFGTVTGQIPAGKDQPIWAFPLFAAVFALIWLAVFSWFVKRLTYDFDLVRHELHWNQWSLFGKKSGLIPFASIRRATVETSEFVEGGLANCPVLLTRDGTFPLLNYSTNGLFAKWRFQHVVTAINAALGPTATSGPECDQAVVERPRAANAIRMNRSHWVFGIWGLANVAAAATLHVWELRRQQWPNFFLGSGAVEFVAVMSMFVPFAQTVFVLNTLDLNSGRGDSAEHRRQVLQRWKQVFFRLPVASSLVVFCFIQVFVLMLGNGTGFSAKLTGGSPANRLLTTGVAILFSAIPTYANLFVVRKCQDIFGPPPGKASRKRAN